MGGIVRTIGGKRMNASKHSRFETVNDYFICPFCQFPLFYMMTTLQCKNRHSFDIAKTGYVNLAPQAKPSNKYDKASFRHRQTILDKGYYQHIYDAILQLVERYNLKILLDVGCGEGYYARNLAKDTSAKLLAFDLSKDSILQASKLEKSKQVNWFVGDLTQLPVKTEAIDGILDIFSPAHYDEFRRVLKKEGYVIKVLPGLKHLVEFRHLAKNQLKHATYDNQGVREHFETFFDIIDSFVVSKTFAINQEDLLHFAEMTPLFFHVDLNKIDFSKLTHLTVEATILVGKRK